MRGDSIRRARTRRSSSLDAVVPQLLDEIVAAVDTAVIVSDLDGIVELWNDAAERIYGWSAAEAVGERLRELLVPVSGRAEGQAIFDGLREGDEWRGTFMCRRRNGSLVPVSVVDVPVLDDAGNVRALVGISRDLTERLRADRHVRSLEALANRTDHAVITITSGRITSWSAGAQHLLGWTADEAVGNEVWMLVPADRHDEVLDVLDRVSIGEAVEGLRTRRLDRSGNEIPVVIDVAPVFDAATQRWIGIVSMRDARSRDEVVEAAIAAELRSKYLLAQSSETVFVLDADGTVRATSSAVGHVLGFEPDELIGLPATMLMHPDDVAAADEAIDLAVSGRVEHPQVKYRRKTSADEWSWAEATLTNRLDDPVIAGIVVNVRDVTEREQALASVVEREARLSAVMSRSSDVAMFFDRDGLIGWVSPAITEALGIRPDSLLGTNAVDLVHPDDRAAALAAFQDGLRGTGDHVRLEFRFIGADGDVRWVEQVATDLVDDPNVGYVVANLRDITDRKRAVDELARLALVDDLTDLPNRNALRELAAGAFERLADDRFCALVFMDVDDFSDVNDALGHVAGDELLVGVARRVEAVLPPGATLTRFGGDQFAILCDGVADLPETLAVTGVVQSALAAPFLVDHKEVFAAVSFGIALSPPNDADVLLRRADVALNRAKKAGRGQTVVFEREQGAESLRRLHYAGEVRRAIARGEIVAHYQPVVDLETGRTVAVEALARWDHPVLGRIPPDVFVPVAESTGLVSELGDQILEQACAAMVEWERQGRRMQVAVNASAVQLIDPAFPDRVAAALARHGLAGDRLAVEVTETAALRDLAVASRTLAALREQGLEVSLDDFGTGYSSLSLLKRLPVTALKVDRSFVTGLGVMGTDDQIVTGVVGLALALGFYVVGEGVENAAQAEHLRLLGCHFGQGYLWSPAVPSDELLATLATYEP